MYRKNTMEMVSSLNGHHSCRCIDSKHWEKHAKVDTLAPLTIKDGGATTLVGSGIVGVDFAAMLGALAPLSCVAGGSTTVVSSGIGSSIVVPVRVRCVNCLGTGREPQLFGLPVDPVCHVCWGYGRVSHGDHVVSHMVAEYGMRAALGGST